MNWATVNAQTFLRTVNRGLEMTLLHRKWSSMISQWRDILTSCGSCNKLLKSWLLNAKQMDYLTVLEIRSMKSVSLSWHQGYCQSCVLSEGFRRESISWPFYLLEALHIPWTMTLFFHLQSLQPMAEFTHKNYLTLFSFLCRIFFSDSAPLLLSFPLKVHAATLGLPS